MTVLKNLFNWTQGEDDSQIEVLEPTDEDIVAELETNAEMDVYEDSEDITENDEDIVAADELDHDVMASVQSSEEDFASENDDYYEAIDFLREQRLAELNEWGFVEEEKQNQIVAQEFAYMAELAQKVGKNPAEMAYLYAKSRGFGDDNGRDEMAALDKAPDSPLSLSETLGSGLKLDELDSLLQLSEEEFKQRIFG